MKSIRELCRIWAKKNYGDNLKNLVDFDKETIKQVKECFESIGIIKKPIDGYSCEGLPKTDEGSLRKGLKNYSDVFHELHQREMFTPVNYLATLVKLAIENNLKQERVNGYVSRGLRSLTSLMREPDFANAITLELKKKDSSASTRLNPLQDAKAHTDVLLTYKDTEYRIWLFQFSERGLPHDIARITEKRGELPSGKHMLCPLNTELAMENQKKEKRINRLNEILDKKEVQLSACSERAVKKKEKLRKEIKKISDDLKLARSSFQNFRNQLSEEIEVVEGWFFYSKKHIERIVQLIDDDREPMRYIDLVDILTKPERLLSKEFIFIK